MDKLIFLGTGHAMTLDCFNTCFVVDGGDDGCTLVDTGGGIQVLRQLRDAGVDLGRIHDVVISHQHTDHLLGLFWVLRAMGRTVSQPEYGGPLRVHMHRQLADIARTAVTAIMPPKQISQLDKQIIFNVVEDGEILTLGNRQTEFFDLYSENERQYGFKMRLKNGEYLLFTGDVPLHERNFHRAQGIDWLMHDAFCLSKVSHRGHSTVLSAAQTAETVGAHNLVLYHGTDNDLKNRQRDYIAEAKTVFGGDVYAPYDLDVIEI